MPKVWWEYVDGEELAIFWQSPYGHGKEKIATFWWPTHPPEATKDIEALFEAIASRISTPKSDSTGSTTQQNPNPDTLDSCQTSLD